MTDSLETNLSDRDDLLKRWDKCIRDKCKDKCVNCGSDQKLAVKPVVPFSAGGLMTESNGILICRTCEMASEASANSASGDVRRPINFLVSRGLYNTIQAGLKEYNGFKSMGSLIRFLIDMYIDDSERFDDLEQYQDEGSDVKINVWIDIDVYNKFKTKVNEHNLTVTNAIKGLVLMYDTEAISNLSKTLKATKE